MSRSENFIRAFMRPREIAGSRAAGWLARIMRRKERIGYSLYQFERAAEDEQFLAYREECARRVVQ